MNSISILYLPNVTSELESTYALVFLPVYAA